MLVTNVITKQSYIFTVIVLEWYVLKIENALKLDSVVLLELPCNFQQEGLE